MWPEHMFISLQIIFICSSLVEVTRNRGPVQYLPTRNAVLINDYSHWTSLTRCQTIGAARSYFMNVWSLGTRASPLTAIEVIPVLPECLRSFLRKYKQDKTARIFLVFTLRASPTNLCLRVLLFDQITFSITDALTAWMCGQEPFARLVLSV